MTTITSGAYDIPASSHRNQTSTFLAPAAGLAVVDGVHSGLALTKTAGMGFKIGPGRAFINGATPADGTFAMAILTEELGQFEVGDATRDRVDLVVLQTYPALTATAATKVEVVKGAYPATGSPVTPATPAGALALFAVPVGAGVSAGNGGWNAATSVDVRKPLRLFGDVEKVAGTIPLVYPYKPLGLTYATPSYEKDASGRVWLSGAIGSQTSSVDLTQGVAYKFGTLPAGVRPLTDRMYPIGVGIGMDTSGLLYVRANGDLAYMSYVSVVTTNFFFTIDGVSW